MSRRFRAILVTFAFLCACGLAHAKLGNPCPRKPDRMWVVLLFESPAKSVSELMYMYKIETPWGPAIPVPTLEMEIRRGKTQAPVLKLPLNILEGYTTVPRNHHTEKLNIELASADVLNALTDGDYVAAMNADGKRCSNVAPFRIDSGFILKAQPVLEIVVIEPAPYCGLPFLGIRATGPAPPERSFRYSSIVYPSVSIDDVERRWSSQMWGGMDPPLSPYQRCMTIVDVGGLEPYAKPGVVHRIEISVSRRCAGPVDFNPGPPLGDAWDAATESHTE